MSNWAKFNVFTVVAQGQDAGTVYLNGRPVADVKEMLRRMSYLGQFAQARIFPLPGQRLLLEIWFPSIQSSGGRDSHQFAAWFILDYSRWPLDLDPVGLPTSTDLPAISHEDGTGRFVLPNVGVIAINSENRAALFGPQSPEIYLTPTGALNRREPDGALVFTEAQRTGEPPLTLAENEAVEGVTYKDVLVSDVGSGALSLIDRRTRQKTELSPSALAWDTTMREIYWQDTAGIHRFGAEKAVVPTHQARNFRLIGIQDSLYPNRSPILYLERNRVLGSTSFRYVAIQDGAVIAQADRPMMIRERPPAYDLAAVAIAATGLPEDLVNYVYRAF